MFSMIKTIDLRVTETELRALVALLSHDGPGPLATVYQKGFAILKRIDAVNERTSHENSETNDR